MIRVLLVEEDAATAQRIEGMLRDELAGQVRIDRVREPSECLSWVDGSCVDIVLIDLMVCGGALELFNTLRRRCPRLPIVVMSLTWSDSVAVEAVRRGAADHVLIDQIDGRLLARTIQYALERENGRRMQAELDATEQELVIARQIQESLFPPSPPVVPGYNIAGASFPAKHVGGDYYDFLDLADGCLGIAIGDASGHGIGAALLSAHTRATLRSLAINHLSVSEIVTLANRILTVDARRGHFMTLLMSRLSPRTGWFVYASAGHDPGFLLDGTGRVKSRLDSTGIPLGIVASWEYPESVGFTLHPGDIVLLMTDGVREAGAGVSELFGLERALELVAEHRAEPAAGIVQSLADAVHKYWGPHDPADDLTVVVVKMQAGTRVAPLPT